VGTLLAFTMVAISVLILRYVPPDVVPLPSSLQESIDAYSDAQESSGIISQVSGGSSKDSTQPLLGKKDASIDYPILVEKVQGIAISDAMLYSCMMR